MLDHADVLLNSVLLKHSSCEKSSKGIKKNTEEMVYLCRDEQNVALVYLQTKIKFSKAEVTSNCLKSYETRGIALSDP